MDSCKANINMADFLGECSVVEITHAQMTSATGDIISLDRWWSVAYKRRLLMLYVL